MVTGKPEITERFNAEAEDGSIYTIIKLQYYSERKRFHLPPLVLPSQAKYQTEEGGAVDMIDDSTFKIRATGTLVKRI